MLNSYLYNLYCILLLVIDLFLFSMIFPIYLVCALIYFRFCKKHKVKADLRTGLFLISSGSMGDIINKFGTLDIMQGQNPYNFFQYLYVCFFPTRRYARKCLNNGMELYDFKLMPHFKCLSTLFYMHGLVKILNNNPVSFVRGFSPYTVGFIGRIVSWISGIPFCVSLHEDDNKRYKLLKKSGERVILGSRRLAKMLEKFVYKTSDMVLPIRESLKEVAIRAGADRNKIRIIPHGVSLNLFCISDNENKYFKQQVNPAAKNLIVSICRHSMDNYVLDIIEAARLLLKKRSDFLFIVAGDGVLHEEVKSRVTEYILSDFVKTPGFVSRKDAIRYWLASDIALCLMGGYSLIEAALAGKPIISYNVEWHYELVQNGKTGFLVKEHNVESVVEALTILLDNPALIRQYGANIKEMARQRHSLEATDKIKVECYKKLLGEN